MSLEMIRVHMPAQWRRKDGQWESQRVLEDCFVDKGSEIQAHLPDLKSSDRENQEVLLSSDKKGPKESKRAMSLRISEYRMRS
jgi:hypothetical protein